MAFISLFDFIASNILIIAALIAVIYIGARYLITHNEKIGLAWERFVLRIPILNKIKKNQDLYNLRTHSVSCMLQGCCQVMRCLALNK